MDYRSDTFFPQSAPTNWFNGAETNDSDKEGMNKDCVYG